VIRAYRSQGQGPVIATLDSTLKMSSAARDGGGAHRQRQEVEAATADVDPPSVPGAVAFGAPGIAPTWSSSDKDYVTSALGGSRVWATIGHGIINEVYWPSTGEPQIREFGFYLVGEHGWLDLKRIRRYRLATQLSAEGIEIRRINRPIDP